MSEGTRPPSPRQRASWSPAEGKPKKRPLVIFAACATIASIFDSDVCDCMMHDMELKQKVSNAAELPLIDPIDSGIAGGPARVAALTAALPLISDQGGDAHESASGVDSLQHAPPLSAPSCAEAGQLLSGRLELQLAEASIPIVNFHKLNSERSGAENVHKTVSAQPVLESS